MEEKDANDLNDPTNILSGGAACDQFIEKHGLSQDQFTKIKEKYKKDKDFTIPSGEQLTAEKEYALDFIIS